MERSQLFDLMGELKLFGMSGRRNQTRHGTGAGEVAIAKCGTQKSGQI